LASHTPHYLLVDDRLQTIRKNSTTLNNPQDKLSESNSYNVSSIALVKRDQLKAGLSGDVDMMISLIAEWILKHRCYNSSIQGNISA